MRFHRPKRITLEDILYYASVLHHPTEHYAALLIQEGGTTRISKDHVYLVSDRQMKLLQEKQLSFETVLWRT